MNQAINSLFSSPDPKGSCEIFPSLCVRHRLFSVFLFMFQPSPKPLDQLELNLVGMFSRWSSTKIMFFLI
jgi:hypothetical protein